MGGKGGGGISVPNMGNIKVEPSEYEKRLAAIANQMYTLTGPLRQYSLEDLGTFMRGPQGATPWTTGASPIGMGTGVAGSTGYTGQATSAPLSSNFNLPSQMSIQNELNNAFKYGSAPTEGTSGYIALTNLEKMGVDTHNQNLFGNTGFALPSDPEQYNTWLSNTSSRIYNDLLNKQLESARNQQTMTPSQPSSQQGTSYGGSGRYDPYQLPAYAPLYQLARTGLESQYNPARENIMASTPRGGALYSNLANLEMSRAQQAGSLPASIAAPIISDLYNKAYGVAWNTPQTSISGLGTAEQGMASRYGTLMGGQSSANNAGLAAAIQQAQMNQQAGLAGSAGLGSLLGMGIKGLTGAGGGSSILGKAIFG